MRIGLDFDNTIAGYDRAFLAAAQAAGLRVSGDGDVKRAVKAAAQASAEGETAWMRLQGQVYGAMMPLAEMMAGLDSFLKRCRTHGVTVFVVSHKTEFGHFDTARVNLRDAARAWMTAQGFFDPDRFALDPAHIFFAATRQGKIERIRELELAHFIDDLDEVLTDPAFPASTQAHLYAPNRTNLPAGPFRVAASWHDLEATLFDRHL